MAEATLAIDRGADAIGLVSAMPSGPGPIPEERIAEVVKHVPRDIETNLLTCESTAAAIIAQHARCGTSAIQLVDRLASNRDYLELRHALPSVMLVQVIHVVDEDAEREASEVAPFVDRLLLDSGNPRLAVKELGGTGRTHNWSISRRIRDVIGLPLVLAGGLNEGNVAAAIAAVEPFGVDVCSGVRTDGALDDARLRAFVAAARGGAP